MENPHTCSPSWLDAGSLPALLKSPPISFPYSFTENDGDYDEELGDNDDSDDIAEIEKKITSVKLSKDANEKCKSELKKLKNMSPMSAEATVVRNYLDWMTELPWHKKSEVDIDLKKALNILDKDHFGLEKVKERIIEFLAVQKRMEKIKGPILLSLIHI